MAGIMFRALDPVNRVNRTSAGLTWLTDPGREIALTRPVRARDIAPGACPVGEEGG
jgi:hypothetical protein